MVGEDERPDLAEMSKIGSASWKALDDATRKVLQNPSKLAPHHHHSPMKECNLLPRCKFS